MTLAVIFSLVLMGFGLVWLIYQLLVGTPPWINWAVERLALRLILADPESLTALGLIDNTCLDFHSTKLTDASPRYMERLRQLDREGLALIRRYEDKPLSGQKRITYLLMRWYFEQNLRAHRFAYHWIANTVFMGPYPVNHVFGVQIDLINFLSTYHKIKGRRSARRYIHRLQIIPWKISGLIESLAERESIGVIPPRFVIEKSIRQIREFLSMPTQENPLYTSFNQKLIESSRFGSGAKLRLAKRAADVITQDVLPAYRSLMHTLEKMLEMATDEDGIWKLPNGIDYYNVLLRMHTTADLTASEVHQLGLEEVEKLTETVRQALLALGLPAEEPGKQLKRLMEDAQYHFDGEGSRQAIIETYQEILDEANQRMPEIFKHGSLNAVVVQRLPEFKEPDSPIAYAQAPAMDGSKPGTMWINLREPENVYRWGMRTLAYHEGIPGHIYQMSQAQKIKGLPTFRKTYFFNAYIEGWALYSEQLGWELGLEDDLSNLGRLQAMLWRAARLVVDTGIHAFQWTRQEAIDYLIEKTGLPERDVTTEVERYIVAPGQACAYYIGYLKMIALRQKAALTLGDAFDLKEFHDVVINHGGLPLSLLERVVNEYVDQKAGLMPAEGT